MIKGDKNKTIKSLELRIKKQTKQSDNRDGSEDDKNKKKKWNKKMKNKFSTYTEV